MNEDNDISDTVFETTSSSSPSPLKQPQTNHHANPIRCEEKQQAIREKMRLWAEEKLRLSRKERASDLEREKELKGIELEDAEWEAKVKAERERQAEEDRRWQQIRDAGWGNGTELDDGPLLS